MVEKQFQTNKFSVFLRKVSIVSEDLIVIGNVFVCVYYVHVYICLGDHLFQYL